MLTPVGGATRCGCSRNLKQRRKAGYIPAGAFVNAYLGLGDNEQAFYWLEQAYREQSNILQFLKTHPYFDPIRGDPRFADLVSRSGLADSCPIEEPALPTVPLRQREVDVLDGFVDFLGVFVADGDAVDSGVVEGEAHGGLAVFVVREAAFAGELHADDAHAFVA